MFSAVIFDMDGLLIDSERTIMAAWVQAAAELGVQVHASAYTTVVGCAVPEATARMIALVGSEAVFSQMREKVVARLHADGGVVFPAMAGAAELMRALAALGVPFGVASSSGIAEVRQRLAAVGLAEACKAMAGGDEVPRGKPDPAVYLLAAQRMGVRPQECLAFEDSENGIRAALAAGLQVVAVPDLVQPDTSRCLKVLASLHHAQPELPQWFARFMP